MSSRVEKGLVKTGRVRRAEAEALAKDDALLGELLAGGNALRLASVTVRTRRGMVSREDALYVIGSEIAACD